jgi:hypothetical protein
MKHTPGPWTVSELDACGEVSEHYIFIEPNVAVIERKVAGHDACDMPDALLLAAAKELLDALQRALNVLDATGATDEANAARAAIAKATGEQP